MKYTMKQRNEIVVNAIWRTMPTGRTKERVDDLLDAWTSEAVERGSKRIKDTHAAYLTQAGTDAAWRNYRRVLNLVGCGR